MNARAIRVMSLAGALALVFAGMASAGGRGPGGPHGGGPGGPGGPGFGPAGLADVLAYLGSETAPGTFTIERFASADTNDDGALSAAEWTAWSTAKRDRILAGLLAHDGEVDADDDGTVDDAELAAFLAARDAEARARIVERHADADTDADGTLSDEEFEAFKAARRAEVLENHPEADLDGDGTLTAEELVVGRLSREGSRPHRSADGSSWSPRWRAFVWPGRSRRALKPAGPASLFGRQGAFRLARVRVRADPCFCFP